ncbi:MULTISPECIES: SDR family NAD(P)-dependent oxidoreductase [Streptomyces]|uniref:SDR family NAD(P)-dependent oxidoreductase n=1 Tax=Streptomyces flaveolus TaxID=67297 RepID=A0ABV3AKJ6_9ACTN|nr:MULTISPECIES: SDR family NAD(P)-dependent oxidoreductase [Streptomyces]
MTKTIFVTASTDPLGAAVARALADADHTVYVGHRQVADANDRVPGGPDTVIGVDTRGLRTVAYEAIDQRSVTAAVRRIEAEAGPVDVVVHSGAPITLGPTESFTPYQLGQLYDACVLSAQRINRAVLPRMRERGDGLLIWTDPPTRPGPAPFLAPGHALRAALGQLAEAYAAELAPFGIDVTIVTLGGTPAEFSGAAEPVRAADADTAAFYPVPAGTPERAGGHPASSAPAVEELAAAVAHLVAAPRGTRPVRVAVGDPGAPEGAAADGG